MKKIRYRLLVTVTAVAALLSGCGDSVAPIEEDTFSVDASAEGEAVTGETVGVGADLNISAEQYAEAKALWVDFLQKTAPLKEKAENGEKSVCFTGLDLEYVSYWYRNATGRENTEFLNMPLYERYLWDCTYLYPKECYHAEYDLSKWNAYTVRLGYTDLKDYEKSDEMAEAYKKLMEWQYYYVKEHGEFFSFVEVFGLDAEMDVTEETTA